MADAEGELMLPGFEKVKKALRIRTLRHYTETGKDSTEMILDTYAWYAAGVPPLPPDFHPRSRAIVSRGK